MLTNFFYDLKDGGVPVSIKEYLMLMEAMQAGCASFSVDDFYFLSRSAFVKDEKNLDKFDRIFGKAFQGIEFIGEEDVEIPEEWLRKMAELYLSKEEMEEIEALGSWEEIMDTLKKRLEEQKERHQGGNKWIGTAGRSPFGAYGYNPEGVRIGQKEGRHGRAIKVWDKREFKNLDDTIELGTRNIKVALRKLRQFARQGEATELDLDGTIKATAHNGFLDLKMVPERHNAVKILLFLDVGGSMDPHIKVCEELFSAARSEFKHLEFFYFHNCLYEKVWKDNARRHNDTTSTMDVLHTFPHDYKVIFIGDASMSPYEISYPGGSVEHWNEEPGEVWMKRMTDIYQKAVWLNPIPDTHWEYSHSIQIMKTLMEDRMYPLTLAGLEDAIKALR
ncbi:vWA domain-containing protein [Kordiimonas sp.]|uniref:vWA domain-containing protein n=1 Tax=Kordiimonas sp. TaxID=1970157 RepID=UPI003A91D2D6